MIANSIRLCSGLPTGNKMSLAKFREVLQKDGIPFPKFREQIREEMTIARVREREVENKILISEGEIDNYLTADAANGGAEERYEIALFSCVQRRPALSKNQKLRKRPSRFIRKLKSGEDFSKLGCRLFDAGCTERRRFRASSAESFCPYSMPRPW